MLTLLLLSKVALAAPQAGSTPQAAVDALLAADRAFAVAAKETPLVAALAAMFAEDVVMPVPAPTPGFARGKAEAVAALNAKVDNAAARISWTPVRGGVSADGRHGFTLGYMTVTRGDGTTQPLKYLAYWTKQPDGWRVAAYKRAPANAGPAAVTPMPPALPSSIVRPVTDAAAIERHRASLVTAEQAFSDEAQKIGLEAAFAKWGRDDATNMGPPTKATMVVGAEAIGKSVGAGTPENSSPVSWAADAGALVASSGDLGVTFGYIRQNGEPPPGRPAAVPFFTIWRRDGPGTPWRYVAE